MKRFSIIILLLVTCWCGGNLRAAPGPHKFLFLVEASAATSARSELTALAVADLIERGLGGRMRTGDIFTIVPFNEQLDPAGYARKEWDANKSRHISNLAFLYLQKYKFEKRTRNDRVMALIQLVTQNERDMVIYLVSSGEDPVLGTPFDADINAIYRENAPKWQAAKAIGVTALVAADAKLADWAVGVAEPPAPIKLLGRKIEVVQPKPPPTNKVEIVTVPSTNRPPSVKPATNQVTSASNNNPPTNQTPAVKPIVIKTNPPAVVVVPPPPTNPPPPEVKPTNTVAIVKPPEIKPEPPPPTPTNPVTKIEVPEPRTNPVVQVAVTNPTNLTVPPSPVPTNAVAQAPPTNINTIATNAVAQTHKSITPPVVALVPVNPARPYGMLMAGIGFLAVAVWLGAVWYRRTRTATGPSLITQSLDRTRSKPPKP